MCGGSPANGLLLAGIYHLLEAEVVLVRLFLVGAAFFKCPAVDTYQKLAVLKDPEVLADGDFGDAENLLKLGNGH